MIYDRQEECMRVTLQMHFTHTHLETLKAAYSIYVSTVMAGIGILTHTHTPFFVFPMSPIIIIKPSADIQEQIGKRITD